MHAALAGRVVTRFESVLPQLARVDDQSPLAGRTIESVRPEGKNLIIDFSGDLHLHTHMRMNGSWHLYKPGEKWRRPRRDMRIVIETDAWVAVGFTIPVAAFHDAQSLARQDDLRHIGPDLLGESFDEDEALRRIRERTDFEIADVLLDQRIVAGIGNEYKSEVLFLGRVHPFAHVSSLGDESSASCCASRASTCSRACGRRTCTDAAASAAASAEPRSRSRSRDAMHARRTGVRGVSLYNARAMAIIMPNGLTPQELRVLQEFRRLNAESLTLEQIKAIKHPAGGGEAPAVSLVDKAWLTTNGDKESFSVTQKAKDLLAIDPKPMFEETGGAGSSAEDAEAEGV